ncbi:MAG TPA: methyltransferase domain-containing protein [Polyangiaceae bacterium]|nr:methyltransferase domain-containing protein [Polyangiaceae bacterium]
MARDAPTSETARLLPHFALLQEGYGSAYERYAIGELMESTARRLSAHTVAEWPANGVLGVPGLKSLPLAFAGCAVTLLNPSRTLLDGASEIWRASGAPSPALIVGDPEDGVAVRESSFDLIWSFCAFEHARDPDRLASEMVRVARGYVMVFVQNAWMPGVHLHRLHHRLGKQRWDHGAIGSMRAESVARRIERAGAELVELGGCDLPPWPDLDVRLPRFGRAQPTLKGAPRPYGPGDAVLSPSDAARVFDEPARLSPPMRFLAGWHDHVERRIPRRILRWLAHHPYVLAKKTG